MTLTSLPPCLPMRYAVRIQRVSHREGAGDFVVVPEMTTHCILPWQVGRCGREGRFPLVPRENTEYSELRGG